MSQQEARKNIPFLVIAIAAAFMAIDMFTPYQMNDNTVQLIEFVLTPIGLGGLVAKGWDTFKAIKTKTS